VACDEGLNSANCSADRRGLGLSVQLSTKPSGPAALKRCTQPRSVWRSMPPIFAATPSPVRPIPHRVKRQKKPARTHRELDRRADEPEGLAQAVDKVALVALGDVPTELPNSTKNAIQTLARIVSDLT
jgi:hypothetical protein